MALALADGLGVEDGLADGVGDAVALGVADGVGEGPVTGSCFWVMLPMVGRSACPEDDGSLGAFSRP